MFLRTLGREGVECPGITLLGGRKSVYSTPQRPRGVEKGARGSTDDVPLTSATFDGYESVFNVNKERVQSRTTHVSVGSEPSWRVEVVGNEDGGGGGRRGELEKWRKGQHEKRRAVEIGGRGQRRMI